MEELKRILERLREPETFETVRPEWEKSRASRPSGRPSFLDPEEFVVSREWSGLDASVDATLIAAADRIAGDEGLRALAWHAYWRLHKGPEGNTFALWPTLQPALGDLAGVFYLLVALSVSPAVRALHRRMGVKERVTRDTLSQVSPVLERYRYATGGLLGVDKRVLSWFRYYLNGSLFRVGRFEYMLRPFRGGVTAYRCEATGAVVALADAGTTFDAEGYVARPDEKGRVWEATLEETESAFIGFPVSPAGFALEKKTTLPKPAWRRALSEGDLVLQMHIPGGGGMTPERCRESLLGAAQFFSRHFPQQPFRGVECRSWIFNTQLQQILPETANLVRFQRELYLFPIRSGERDGLYFIFCRDDIEDWRAAPRDTSLRRAVADFLAAGSRWRSGGMFILNEELPQTGSQPYLRRWPPKALKK